MHTAVTLAQTSLVVSNQQSGKLHPNLIIPGAQKCGTTALHALLSAHPEILMLRRKETNVFCSRDPDLSSCKAEYQKHRTSSKQRFFGESSTRYFSDPEVPRRIYDHLGTGVRFIVLLRSPVERAISAYWHMVKRGAERRSVAEVFGRLSPDLHATIADEDHSIRIAEQNGMIDTAKSGASQGEKYWNFRYIRNSWYPEFLQRYCDLFGRNGVLVVLSEELASQPEVELSRVAEFLGISPQEFPREKWQKHNETLVPKSFFGLALRNLALSMPGGPLRRLRETILKRAVGRPPDVSAGIKQSLSEIFRGENGRLAQYLGRDLSVWEPKVEI